MERDLGKTGDEPMAQEPEKAEAPAASFGGDQEEKMQEEETAVMKTKRRMEDEETEARRLWSEPKNPVNSDIDMDEELTKLKMQNWGFVSMVKVYDFRRAIDRCEHLANDSLIQFFGGANRSTSNVVMNFMTKVNKKQAKQEERFFVLVQDRVSVSGVVLMIKHERELGSAITRHGRL